MKSSSLTMNNTRELALVFLFSLLVNIGFSQPGSTSCSSAVPVNEGSVDNADNSLGDQWYRYTAPANNRLIISSVGNATQVNTFLQIYDACSGTLLRENDNANGGTFKSEAKLPLAAGSTIYIVWRDLYTNATFDWDIFHESLIVGDLCQIPNTATLGTNSVTNFVDGIEQEEWFVFTPVSGGYMTVENCGLTSVDSKLSLYSECGEVIESNDNSCATQSSITYPVIASEDYFILWENDPGVNSYDWEISIEGFQPGEDCSVPLTALEGNTNTADHTGATSQWYEFTPGTTQKMTLSSCGLTTEDTQVHLFDACYTSSLISSDDFCSTQSALTYIVDGGQTYFIEWTDVKTSSSYNWGLSLSNLEVGDVCTDAKSAVLGSNTSVHSDGLSDWFSFTATENGMITISSCGLTSENTIVQVFSACGGAVIASNDNACSNQSEVEIEVTSGVTYYIEWAYTEAIGNYSWDLSYKDITGGDSCAEAVTIEEGSIRADNSAGSEWYTFTLNTTSKVDLSYCSSMDELNEDTQVNIYGACGSNIIYSADDECNATGSRVRFTAFADTEYLVEWTDSKTSATYDWDFSVSSPGQGDVCEQAEQAVLGTNVSHNFNNRSYWFYYTPSENGTLSVSSCIISDYDTRVSVFETCGGSEIASNDDFCSTQSSLDVNVQGGVTYYIQWENKEINDDVAWELSFTQAVGLSCENPIEAMEGNNTTDNSSDDQWFVYTPSTDGQLTVSSCGLTSEDTFIAIYDACDGSTTIFNDDGCGFQSSTALYVEAGVPYYLVWLNNFTSGTYQWNLSLSDPVAGEICEAPLQAMEGINQADNSKGTSQWFEFAAPSNGRITLATCGYTTEDTFVVVYESCGAEVFRFSELECPGQSDLTFDVTDGTTYLIEWSNRFTGGQYDWNLDFQSSETDILTLTVNNIAGDATIDLVNHTVNLTAENGTDITNLSPTITLSDGASIAPESNATVDFTNPVTYVVTAEDGVTTQEWMVSVQEAPNNEADILSFVLAEQVSPAIVDANDHTIRIEIASDADITNLSPTIEVSVGATITPTGSQDFKNDFTYLVEAEDQVTVQVWTVSVSQEETEPPLSIWNPEDVTIYPNPVVADLHVESIHPIESVSLFSLDGKRLEMELERGKGVLRIPVSHLRNGVYLLVIKSGDESRTTTIVKK